MHFSTSPSACQELFSESFKEFSILHFERNSSFFSAVPSKLHRFPCLFVSRSLERSDILSHHLPFVNTFFHLFFIFLFPRKKWLSRKKGPLPPTAVIASPRAWQSSGGWCVSIPSTRRSPRPDGARDDIGCGHLVLFSNIENSSSVPLIVRSLLL